jgi:hypothetical protein
VLKKCYEILSIPSVPQWTFSRIRETIFGGQRRLWSLIWVNVYMMADKGGCDRWYGLTFIWNVVNLPLPKKQCKTIFCLNLLLFVSFTGKAYWFIEVSRRFGSISAISRRLCNCNIRFWVFLFPWRTPVSRHFFQPFACQGGGDPWHGTPFNNPNYGISTGKIYRKCIDIWTVEGTI